jgi:hypothetical protein
MKNVRKFLEVSTGNLPEITADLICAGQFPKPPAYTNEYGWIFHVPEHINELEEQGIVCHHFINIMALAIDAECDYVMFDRDTEAVEWLPKFDW